ncbi:hypothetical protein ACL02T_15330 [Pseudonocardia sp. RS010]|uniref:hypothetical protein n=1 Tax=Pseudonocardia sp. RS010 TaxID=3385979 RepID=UPI00399FCA6E
MIVVDPEGGTHLVDHGSTLRLLADLVGIDAPIDPATLYARFHRYCDGCDSHTLVLVPVETPEGVPQVPAVEAVIVDGFAIHEDEHPDIFVPWDDVQSVRGFAEDAVSLLGDR